MFHGRNSTILTFIIFINMSKKLKYSELVIGNVYHASDGSATEYIIEASHKGARNKYIRLKLGMEYGTNGGFEAGWPDECYTPASQEDVLWLKECIKQNKLVDRE